MINPPLPSNLRLALNAKTVTIGPSTQVFGDVGSAALNGSVLFDVSSSQGFGGNVLASTVKVGVSASVGHIFGNDITVDGSAAARTLGLDPTALPAVPAVTPSTAGTTNLSVAANQSRQLCPGQYGNISLGANATLSLNGGIYQINKLTLADGAKLEPSEPVVVLIAGGLTTGTSAVIAPFPQVVNPMTAANIRIEVGGAATVGDSSQVRAHLLVTGKLTFGKTTNLTGAAWAKTIAIGAQSAVFGEGAFSATAPSVPPPCNDNSACTVDECVGSGTTVAFCRNTPLPVGTSCADGNACNGDERCDAAGQCQPGTTAAAGTSCADGTLCNGDETCNGSGTCVSGPPPVVSDANSCTADTCDAITGVSHTPLPDGTTCGGTGTCTAGVCSVQAVTFTADFVSGVGAPAQCDSWNAFRDALGVSSYGSITMSGTFDPTGVSCNDPAIATQICRALHTPSSLSVFCNGRVWNVGGCGPGIELSADGSTCLCDTGYVARPCIGSDNPNWGGMNTQTCFAPSQTMTVTCQ